MKKTLKIHEPSSWKDKKEWAFQYTSQRIADVLKSIYQIRDNLEKINFSGIKHSFQWYIGYSHLYSTQNYTYNYLYYSNQLSYAWYKYAMNAGKAVMIQIADKNIETVGKMAPADLSYVSSYYALSGIYTSLVLRDKEASIFLANVPLDFINQYGQEDMITETMLLFYQVLIKDTGTKNEAQSAYYHITKQLDWEEYKKYVMVEGFNSEYVWQILFEYRKRIAECIFLPVLNIYHQILNQSQTGFEEAVYKALESWKYYYTLKYIDENKEERDNSTEPEGYLALPIVAACAFAYDRGIKLETIESDYIPKWMIEGRFDGFELLVKGDNSI